ncbi:hypothetical protein CC78DRAFT_570309 [Lojkania enalia]|uniref:protein-tyrosine-phosphatase n=1 Tax=Lojkania enalia TaxID=147567 RepID=A0A9P4K416_9PLEO|nr:hypothetical protein CC78DRAFT_570309 [Didymosphaeria enalia]
MATTTTTTTTHNANSPTLKRSFVPDLVPNTTFPSKKIERARTHSPIRPYSSRSPFWSSSRGERSLRAVPPPSPTRTRRPSMPVQATSRPFVPMPSFMAVFGEESGASVTRDHGSSVARPASSGNLTHVPSSTNTFSAFHVHRDSTSTLASESSDSSPTTTISTMDSSSVTDPSPGPSPESPIAKVAPSSFVADFRSRKSGDSSADGSQTTFFELQRPTTPAKKPRNLKNLGINTASSLSNLRSNPTAPLPALAKREKNPSAPTSPSFIKPPTPPKRRPSNLSLTIQTPGSDSKPTRLIIPSTPAINRPALRHFQSSPSLPLCSPSAAPSGGVQFPVLRPIKTNPHGFAEVPQEMEEEDQEPNFDIPQSREEKPAAYPHGPICIYESGVYLYFEPTAEQAATFDVIVNVASEVKNPFTNSDSTGLKDLDARRVDGPPAENVDFATLPEKTKSSFDTSGSSPTTPKATPILESIQPTEHVVNGTSYRTPEYIHMPWEHNTDIVPDLYKLVKTIDERVQGGKRVLVHCQCGVSRSASLIVAYGLYKNPGISVQEAYDLVKRRSKWIGPNMNLIMQLQEFRNGLLRANENRAYHNQVFGLPRRSAGLPTTVSNGTNRRSPFDVDAPSGNRTPRTAPLPPDSDMGLQRASTGNIISISPGPLSAPSGAFFSPGFRRSWASSQTHFDLLPKSSPTSTPYVDPKGHIVPILSITDNEQPSEAHTQSEEEDGVKPLPVPNFSRQLPLRSHPSSESSRPNGPPKSANVPMASMQDELDTLMSPTASRFNIPPLLSPRQTEPSMSGWYGMEASSQSLSRTTKPQAQELPMSPRSTKFHMTKLSHSEIDESYDPLSPRATTFDFGPRPSTQPPGSGDQSSQQFDIASPTSTEFPKDMFPPTGRLIDEEMTSPRATEFHMTPLNPREADEDPFGLTSPRQFEFPKTIFGKRDLTLSTSESETRRPSFQAILPPSHLAQPESVNGFTSLNGTAYAEPTIPTITPLQVIEPPKPSDSATRIDSLSTSLDNENPTSLEPHTPTFGLSDSSPHDTTKSSERTFLSTPPKPTGIRTRFSSPNMREQRKLHKLQTEMEALLPHRAPRPPQAVDDLDALMSPRAEEFTRNPFHMDLRSFDNDASPASSNETIKDGQNHHDWQETQQMTPSRAVEEDPRSPVQTGSSPIVRSIWDVL